MAPFLFRALLSPSRSWKLQIDKKRCILNFANKKHKSQLGHNVDRATVLINKLMFMDEHSFYSTFSIYISF